VITSTVYILVFEEELFLRLTTSRVGVENEELRVTKICEMTR
jgi:hypothetical protein